MITVHHYNISLSFLCTSDDNLLRECQVGQMFYSAADIRVEPYLKRSR